jgi:hypothetical protein
MLGGTNHTNLNKLKSSQMKNLKTYTVEEVSILSLMALQTATEAVSSDDGVERTAKILGYNVIPVA